MSEPASPAAPVVVEAFDDPGLDEYVKDNWRQVRLQRGWSWERLGEEFARMPGCTRLEQWARGSARAAAGTTRAQLPAGRTRKPAQSA